MQEDNKKYRFMEIEQDSYRMILVSDGQEKVDYGGSDIGEKVVQTLQVTDTKKVLLLRRRDKVEIRVPEFLFNENKKKSNLTNRIRKVFGGKRK